MNLERFVNQLDDQKCVYIKVGNFNALSNMQKGTWWFQHPAYFQKSTDGLRNDKNDSIIKRRYLIGKIPHFNATVTYEEYDDCDSARILCFYKLLLDKKGDFQHIDRRMMSFGSKFVFVDVNSLMEKIKAYLLEKQGEYIYSNLAPFDMFYYPETYYGEIGGRGKEDIFSFQCEYRLRIDSIKFIKDIARIKEVRIEEKNLHDALVAQENEAALYRNTVGEDKKNHAMKVMDYHKQYEDAYERLLTAKSIHEEITGLSDCTSEVYDLDKLLQPNCRLSLFDVK